MKEIIEAIDSWHASLRKLKSLRVSRSQKWIADYGEWLVTMLFDGDLAESSTCIFSKFSGISGCH